LERDEFEEVIEEALASLPEEFSRRLQNIEIVVEDEPSEEVLRKLRLPRGGLLGLYHGVPLKKQSIWAPPTLPGKISIYRIPILSISRTRKGMRERIRNVVIHEVGHHFGLSDGEMNADKGGTPDPQPGARPPRQRKKR
jgi:predicted Zn-dependent protease with MMP-like domain